MTTGVWRVLIIVPLLVSTLAGVPNSASSGGEPPSPNSIFQADVPTWYVGDTWTYSTHLQLRMDRNRTDLYGSTTFTVTQQFSVTQNGTYHEAYNVSLSGSYTGTGSAYVSGITLGISVDSAMLRGFQWIDRADLSLIRDNESLQAAGNVTYLIFRYPLTLRFATESNRSPSQEDYDFPLIAGDAWSFAGNMRSIGFYFFSVTGTPFGDLVSLSPFDHNTTMDFDASIADIGTMDVGGNSYYYYHILETPPSGSSRLGDSNLWYSPAVKNNVRWYLTASTVDFVVGGFINLTSYTLNPDPFGVTLNLNPQIVNPGGFVNVTGVTGPGYAVWIRTPWNRSAWAVATDGGGNYRFTIQAPANDDNTPCNADVGSHGVLVEAVNPADIVAYNASTVVLMVPDLAVSGADLSFSSPPRVGVPTTVRAIVHASPNVGVYNPIEVEFRLDSSFLATDTTSMMPQGSQHTFMAAWIPASGTHTIAVIVDPGDLIKETNENNNYAEIGAITSYPDLVPWNITVSDGDSVHYDDPATAGFATPLLNGSWGEQYTISFGVRNVGTIDFVGRVGVQIVETQSPGGPPIAPPIYDQTLDVAIQVGSTVDAPPASWLVPQTHATYFFNLTIDPANLITESFEANNTFAISISVGAPDLTIGVTGPARIPLGGTGNATIGVRNEGDKASLATSMEVRNVAGGGLLATVPVGAMNPGAASPTDYPLGSLTNATGSVCLQFDIDKQDMVVESNETNNGFRWCFEVTPLPDTSLIVGAPVYVGVTYTYITNATNVTFDARDNSGTGIRKTQYSVDGGPWTDYIVGVPVHLSLDGLRLIRFNSTDNVGGAEPPKTDTLFVDNIPPATAAVWDGTAVTVSAADGGCGLNKTFYRLDSGSFAEYQVPFTVTGSGQHTVWYYSADMLGNVETQHSLSFVIEPPPETSLILGTPVHLGVTYTYITSTTDVTFDAHDNSGTGIYRTQYSVDGGQWLDFLVGVPAHLTIQGPHVVRFNSTDNAGGTEATKIAMLFVDDIAPTTNATWNGTAVAMTAVDAGCGLNKTYYRLDSGSLTPYQNPFSVTGEGPHTVWFYSVDMLGNIEPQRSISFTIGGGTSGAGGAGENVKPYVAVIFMAILLAAYLLLRREDKGRRLLITATTFIIAEAATGLASLAFEPLSYVPSADKALGLYIDLIILILGIAVFWVTHKSATPEAGVPEPAAGEPEEKA